MPPSTIHGKLPAHVPPPPSIPDAEPRPGPSPTLGGPPHFTLFGIPVRIGFGFWIMTILLGAQGGLREALLWSAIVFFSVMLHELGHAVVGRAFGARPSITLHALGGLTFLDKQFTRPRSILVSLSGPGAGFVVGGLVWAVTRGMHLGDEQRHIVAAFLWVNIGWGIINLLPVVPFDGGHVLEAALGPRRAFATAVISAIVGAGIAILGGVFLKSIWLAFLFGSAAASAIGRARHAWSASVDMRAGLDDQLAQAKKALELGEPADAIVLADDVVRRARSQSMKNGAWTALAWAHVAKDEGKAAREALSHVEPKSAVDVYLLAAVEDVAGEPRKAREILEEARRRGLRAPQTTKLLVDLLARDGRVADAVGVATDDAKLLSVDEARAVLDAAFAAGEPRAAAAFAAQLDALHPGLGFGFDHARALIRAGQRDAALDLLSTIVPAGGRPTALDHDDFAPLQQDERFRRLGA